MGHDRAAALVADIGSSLCKVGIAGEDKPRAVFSPAIGRPKEPGLEFDDEEKCSFIGNEAARWRDKLVMRSPIRRGVVTDWSDMEEVWCHLFGVMEMNSSDRPVLLTEPPLNPKINRERMGELLFETFQVQALHVAPPGLLSLTSCACNSGIVLDSGHGVTHTMPIYEGYSCDHAIRRQDLAGADVTEHLVKSLKERSFSFSSAEKDLLGKAKEMHCFVAEDYKLAPAEQREETFELPDGRLISLAEERYRSPEVLFQPNLLRREDSGVHGLIFESVSQCDCDVRKELFGNVVLSGGSMMFPGMGERIRKELIALAPATMNIKVTTKDALSVWLGGSIRATCDTFEEWWITPEQYFEVGRDVVHYVPRQT